jgi:hypothetical protein
VAVPEEALPEGRSDQSVGTSDRHSHVS